MTALQYMGTGILFALVAGICFVGAIVYFLLTKQKHYLYTERLGRMKFPEQFYKDMKEQYEKTENISQTLDLLLEQYPKGKVAKRLYPWALSIGIMSLNFFVMMGFFKAVGNFKENMTIELMIEAMIKVVVLNVLLVKGLDVIKKIFEMASAMAGTAVMIEPPAFFTGDVDVGSVMFFWIYGLFYFLVAMVCAFLILITLYSRYIKLYLLVVTFPLAMPSITGGRGIEGTAYAWMKSFLSNTFEIVIIALAIAIAGRITSGISIFTSDSAIFNTFDGFAQALNSMIYMILMAVSVKGAPTFLNKTFNL